VLRKLVIISGSTRILKEPVDPIPALHRFDGMFIRIIRKYYTRLSDCDVLILSPTYGLIKAKEKIGFKQPIPGSWGKLVIADNEFLRLKESSISTLQKLLATRQYDEIYVNLGKGMLKIIEGLDKIVPQRTKITYAYGSGIGPKMAHMKNWIESHLHTT